MRNFVLALVFVSISILRAHGYVSQASQLRPEYHFRRSKRCAGLHFRNRQDTCIPKAICRLNCPGSAVALILSTSDDPGNPRAIRLVPRPHVSDLFLASELDCAKHVRQLVHFHGEASERCSRKYWRWEFLRRDRHKESEWRPDHQSEALGQFNAGALIYPGVSGVYNTASFPGGGIGAPHRVYA